MEEMSLDDFDWRIYGVTSLEKDLPYAGPGTFFHKAGTPVYPATLTQWNNTRLIFGTPSTIKLSFDIALTAGCQALAAKDQIDLVPHGSGLLIPPESFPYLYDYFQHFMATVVFSCQTIEIFSNFVIDSVVGKGTAYVQLAKKKDPKHHNAIELQKESVSQSTKLLEILPKILDTPSIEVTDLALWGEVKKMNALRNSIIHMKPLDVKQGAAVDKDSVYTEIINKKPMKYPFIALRVMDYYRAGIRHPLWLQEMQRQYITRSRELQAERKESSRNADS